jgi:MoaA/NifB/PqqE/SkfB family radical SAM enzyme
MKKQDIKWLHAEISTRCNAWCPGCQRNNNGYGLSDLFVEQDLQLTDYQRILDQFDHLEGIQFCGNFGDPIAHNDFFSIVKHSKLHCNKIQIHTNGGLRSQSWWKKLAEVLHGHEHDVWFGIDGIGSVHEQYRQGTSYKKVLENAQAFISAGGTATWQFIPFKHNEHQIKDCIRLSQDLGFYKFKLVKSFREDQSQVRHWQTGEHLFKLEAADVYKKLFFHPTKTYVDTAKCQHLSMPSVYLHATGKISACCYFTQSQHYDNLHTFLSQVNISNELANSPHQVCLQNCGS